MTRSRAPLRLSLALLLPLLLVGGEADVAGQGQAARYRAAARAMDLLEEGLDSAGELAVLAVLVGADATSEGGEQAQLDVLVDLARFTDLVRFRVSVVVARLDDEPLVLQEAPVTQELEGAAEWLFRQTLALPEDVLEVAVVVEELETGLWGSVVAGYSEAPLEATGSRVVRFAATETEAPAIATTDRTQPAPATSQPAIAPRPPAPRTARSGSVIQILPPRNQPVTGSVRVRTFVSDAGIRKVVFYLDGEQVAVDEDEPFSASLELGREVKPHAIKAEAFGLRDLPLGEDSILINQLGAPFRVRIVDLEGDVASGALRLGAEVTVPPDADLDRVEFYLGERLLETRREPPFEIEAADAGATDQDFVRVVAFLADGTSLDDARLVGQTGITERVEVNLVELYVVVTDREGRPRDDLDRDLFSIRYRGKEQPIQRFGLAEQVPLDLGLVIDTSESMKGLIDDTKKAGAQFLTQILEAEDEAFLVDFDNEPRLAHPSTHDEVSLVRAFGRLVPNGFTAMYDAIIFSMLQFEGGDGRRALILLTDGDDYRSRFSQRRCIDYSQELGVPVYIIALGGIHNPRAGLAKMDLEGITKLSGGRIEYIQGLAPPSGIGQLGAHQERAARETARQLSQAYARIEKELRSQYLLTFSTDRPLTRQELREVQVKVAGRGFKVRTVVGARPGDGASGP